MMKLRILVMDEDPGTRKALVIGLSSEEWTVDAVADGTSGVEYADQYCYDLLITDIPLPDVDGLGLLKKIRQKLPEIMIIVITGQCCVDILDENFLQVVNSFYPKPLSLTAIKRAIQLECKKKGGIHPKRLPCGDSGNNGMEYL